MWIFFLQTPFFGVLKTQELFNAIIKLGRAKILFNNITPIVFG